MVATYVQFNTCIKNSENCTENLDTKRLPKPISKLCSRILQFAKPLFINKDLNLLVNYSESFICSQRSETLGQLNSLL